jgi:hypothetical protein
VLGGVFLSVARAGSQRLNASSPPHPRRKHGFQSRHYWRVGGFAALASARTSTLVDRFRAAQQINPACGRYYDKVYWITFAGMAITDDQCYVIGVMMDNQATNADGAAGPLGAMRWITSGLAVSFDEEFRSTVAAAIDAEQFDQFLEGAEHRQAVVDNMVTESPTAFRVLRQILPAGVGWYHEDAVALTKVTPMKGDTFENQVNVVLAEIACLASRAVSL